MVNQLGRVAPGLFSKINLFLDLYVLGFAVHAALSRSSTPVNHLPGVAAAVGLTAAVMAAWIVAATALRHYDPRSHRALPDDLAMVGVLVLAAGTVLGTFFLLTPATGLRCVGWFLAMELPLAAVLRLALRPLLAREGPLADVLVLGVGPLGRTIAGDIARAGVRQRVAGHLSLPGEVAARNFPGKVLGEAAHLDQILAAIPVDEVYLAGTPMRHGEAIQAAIKVCETLGVGFALPQYNFRFDRSHALGNRHAADGFIHFAPVEPKPAQMALKRLFDVVVSGAAVWLLLPLLLTIAALVKLTSRGPVLFRQVRVGMHGATFNMLKFRSMVTNAEELQARLAAFNEQAGPVFKIRDDPRITRLGRFLRKHSLDELPQIINVLRGDMSIVGPRPPLPSEVKQYQAWQRRRLSVRPGVTCIWQVSGRNQISFDDWMYLDMRYIDHWSLGQDVKLVLQTVPIVVNGRGAA
jgi:exopolysaccharide biosynthesis polyprenyl glycosylphosphotransferase